VIAVSTESTNVHVPFPEHPPPDQPLKVEPESEIAVKVTGVPEFNVVEQFGRQLMLPTFDVTIPLPDPSREIVRVAVSGISKRVEKVLSPDVVLLPAASFEITLK
jgi:hypothetical protein